MRWLVSQFRRRCPGTPQPLVVATGRQPFEVLLLAACVLSGTVGLVVPGGGSRTIDEFIPAPFGIVYHVVLVISAGIALVGVFLNMPLSLLVERVGLLFLSGLLLAYAVALYSLHGGAVGVSGAVIGAFGLAAVLRSWQITRDLRKLHEALTHPAVTQSPVLVDPDSANGAG